MGLCVEIHLEKENCFRKLWKQKIWVLTSLQPGEVRKNDVISLTSEIWFFHLPLFKSGKIVELNIVYSSVYFRLIWNFCLTVKNKSTVIITHRIGSKDFSNVFGFCEYTQWFRWWFRGCSCLLKMCCVDQNEWQAFRSFKLIFGSVMLLRMFSCKMRSKAKKLGFSGTVVKCVLIKRWYWVSMMSNIETVI